MSRQLLCAFHPSNTTFAIISHDQRLKLFNVLSQSLAQELTEPSHLAHTITALAYPTAGANVRSHLIAVGMKSGDIFLWNTKKGVIEQKLGVSNQASQSEKHHSAITSLAFHPNGAFLFSSALDKTLKQWNVTSGTHVASFTSAKGGEEAPTHLRLACSADGNLLLAGGIGSLLLWNISTPSAPVRDYQGPTSRIACVAFSADSRFVASGTTGERYVTIWSAEAEQDDDAAAQGEKKKKKKSKSSKLNLPLHTITLASAPLNIQFNAFASSSSSSAAASSSSTKQSYLIGALSDSSILSVANWSSSSSTAATSTPQSVISIPASTSQSEAAKRRDAAYNTSGKNNKHRSTAASSTLLAGEQGDAIGAGAIQAFSFEAANKLLIARGDAVRPQFDAIEYSSTEGSDVEFKAEITLGMYEPKHLMSSGAPNSAVAQATAGAKRKAAPQANEAVTLGSLHAMDTTQASSEELDGAKKNKKQKLSGGAGSKSKSDALSRSLADRLAESDALASSSSVSFNLTTGELPKAGSLQTILQQALHSNDVALIEYCLTAGAQQSSNNTSLIRLTVKRLSPTYILPLLSHLMNKFASRPNRSAALLPWLREIFKCHTSYLIKQPQLTHKLSPLYHLLDTRLSVFKKLLKLQGRLELLLSQLSASKVTKEQQEEEDAMDSSAPSSQGPLNTFNDGEEANEEDDEQDEDEEENEDEEMNGEDDDDDDNDDGEDDGEDGENDDGMDEEDDEE